MTERQQRDNNIKLASNEGIQALTMKNISGKIGISEPALYRHYDSKKEIILGILHFFEELTEVELDPDTKAFTAVEKLKHILEARIERFETFPEVAYLMLCFDIFMRDNDLKSVAIEIIHKHKSEIISIILSGQQSGEIMEDSAEDELFMLVIGPFRLLLTQWFLNGYNFDLKTGFDKLWKTISISIQK